jgi:hypothetical protein
MTKCQIVTIRRETATKVTVAATRLPVPAFYSGS